MSLAQDKNKFLREPEKPLKILTIDGGGLQAISTLLILDTALNKISKKDAQGKKPRPCDIFDTIAGIGCGGWLAILLGRFHMDIAACLTEWYNLMEAIQPNSKTAGLKYRFFQQCFYDHKQLTDHIEQLTKLYGTGKYMIDDSTQVRCRHVFVAALEEKNTLPKYNLFRTYRCQTAPERDSLRHGPQDPETYEISRAFGVTGAARYFAPTWEETMDNGLSSKFRDTKFPYPHNITELALDEMWGLYGPDVPISVVVNIGPGLPNERDIEKLTRKVSWPPSVGIGRFFGSRRSTSSKDSITSVTDSSGSSGTRPPGAAVQGLKRNPKSSESIKVDDTDIEKKLQRKEEEIEREIVSKLSKRYGDGKVPYFRLALETSPKGAPRNDSRYPKRSSLAVDSWYLKQTTELEKIPISFERDGSN
ncbi:MAG: hypothetical protein MMC33_010602 [Icmadophila ericetorum]|nr:hypothetical protein [Icmadophila ericetorum]